MRIPCPYCGSRDASEFSYSGDATLTRPAPENTEAMFHYVYLRDNPVGVHREYWYHAAGCHAWLKVTRNVSTHEVIDAVLAHDEAAS
ncbi:sarcosine oxidase subunit delta [Tardiphaga sp. 804_B3_N1_9]|uniref:sarcosine oxidase subunit delta n=1 Tax=Tardiphaga TaxID=1395974 RepID=UPI0015868964|nr:sarcosine oxidase subunit delta [Tardiphaga robiniae]NUU44205.1 sarcosine oxidase subunit delta [Tardiphaga robiniae]